jgi:hypothetical protein
MAFPLAQLGKLIGFPHTGTHTLGNWQSDNAVDIAVPVGTPMVAMEDGVVTKVTRHPQGAGRFAGDQITIRGASGQEYFYAHGISSVHPSQVLKGGQVIGTSGSANGVAHLHLGVMKGDPRKLLGKPTLRDGKGIVQGAVDAVTAGPKAAAGVVTGAADDAATATARAFFNLIWGAVSDDAAKAGLYVVLVGGGVFLLVAGISRATGAHPARAAASAATTVIPEARAARAVAA